MDQNTISLIAEYSPIWTNKQVWEFEQIYQDLKFDVVFIQPSEKINWNSNLAYIKCNIRDVVIDNFELLLEGYELWISNSQESKKLDKKYITYTMTLVVDIAIDEEIPLRFRIDKECLVISADFDADVIDCKEFFEEFYHLATGVNYDIDTGIPDDQTEAEIYLTRLQEEFDERMIRKLGETYLPGNNDPDSINNK